MYIIFGFQSVCEERHVRRIKVGILAASKNRKDFNPAWVERWARAVV